MRAKRRTILALGILLAGASCSPHPATSSPRGGRANLDVAGTGVVRSGHVAALLADGRVLLAGGTVPGAGATSSAQVFDPSTGRFAATGALSVARVHATATVLADGRVLVVGGDDGAGNHWDTAEIWSAATGTFDPALTSTFSGGRSGHTATRLRDGRVLVIGGRSGASTVLDTVEVYTPAPGGPGTWTESTHRLLTPRARHTATLFGGGAVLVAGGEAGNGAPIPSAAAGEAFDPATGSTATGAMGSRTRHVAALLPGGDVLVVGGWDGTQRLATAQIYRPGSNDFAAAPDLSSARADATATPMPDGRVVVAGGDAGAGATPTVDVYEPGAASASAVAGLDTARTDHVATLLPSGRILLSGGCAAAGAAAEVLDPLHDRWTAYDPDGYVPTYGHTATVLVNGPYVGQVLVVGGFDPYGGTMDSVQAFEPVARTLTGLPGLVSARAFHTATVLHSGDVLVAGGQFGTELLATARVFHASASTPTWSDVGSLAAPRAGHTATLLPSGKVLVAGGRVGTQPSSTAEVFDPESGAFSPVANGMSAPRAHHAAVLLRSGRVLVLGGDGTATADVYDPVTNRFSPVGSLLDGVRAGFTATPLADGRVLIAGGTDGAGAKGTAELFDGVSGFVPVAGALTPRYDHAAVALPSGEVILAGGRDGGGNLPVVERYEPSSGGFIAAGLADLDQARRIFTATLLPTSELLAWGGATAKGAPLAQVDVYDVFDPPAPVRPDLGDALPLRPRPAGASVTFTPAGGSSFLGADAGSGDSRASPAYAPVFVLTREDGDGIAFAETTAFAPGSATVHLPDGLAPGWWWIRAIVDGVAGDALPLLVLDAFLVTPATAQVPPRGSLTFSAQGGSGSGYSWAVTLAGSASAETPGHPTIDAAGVYVAGGTGDAIDTVQCTDGVGNTVAVDVVIGPGVTVSPAGPWAAAPRGAIAFSAAGGSGTGFTWSYPPGGNRSGGTLGADGAYRAGTTGGVSDDLQVVDSLGNHAEVTVAVQQPIAIAPTTASLTPLGTATFTVSGGAGGYSWSLSTNGSGGSVDGSGNYQAGRTGSTTDVVRVTDSLGSFAEATVTVGAGVSILPASPTTPPRGALSFSATGGTGTGYEWSLATNASGGGIDPLTGAYTAGATPGVTDVVRVQDSIGNFATMAVAVGPGITVHPAGPWRIAIGGAIAFSATGGSGTGFTWSYQTGGNRSGGTLGAGGAYQAGPAAGSDDLQVVDSLGNHAEVTVDVFVPLALAPLTASVTPLGTAAFTATGGAGGYTWTVSTNRSGGSVDGSGNYQAGRTGGVTDVVRVTDGLGSFVEATVTVGAAVSIVPASPSAPPRGQVSFSAAGGTATGFQWSLATNASGGDVDPVTGVYTAGATPGVIDVVRVQDSIGNFATMAVAVGPGITVTPAEPGAYPGQTVELHAEGGSGTGFTWAMDAVTSDGGRIDAATGVYTAGARHGATDVVRVTDSLGNQATVEVMVWPDWQASGSGCSSSGGGGLGFGGFLLLGAALLVRGRSRRSAARLAALGIGLAVALLGSARAQTPPVSTSFVVDRFQPTGGAYDLLGVSSAQVPGHGAMTLRAYGSYGRRPLVLGAPGTGKVALLKAQSAADLTLSCGLLDWGEVSAVLSGVVSQSREQDGALPPELRRSVASSGLADARLVPKVRLADWRGLRLGVAVPIGIPIGDRSSFLGHGGLSVAPNALLELDALGPARVLVNAGAIFRPERQLVDLTVGNALTYAVGLELPFRAGDQRLSGLATFGGEAGLKDRSAAARPMELLGGVRWSAPRGVLVSVGGGPGIGKGYGTPVYRVFAEIGFTTASVDRLARRTEPEPEPIVAQEEPKPEEPKPEPPRPEAQPEPQEQAVAKAEPPPRWESMVEAQGALRIEARVLFESNRRELEDGYRTVLRRVAQRILAEPRMALVRIEGHADDLGTPDYNFWLSEERARVVMEFLRKEGVPADRMAIIGFGKTRPVRPIRNAGDRALNRRVEFRVYQE